MAWLELSLTLPAARQAQLEAALDALGAVSVTLSDADADTPDERAIFEPGVGETPLWNAVAVQALFPADRDRPDLLRALAERLPELNPEQVAFRDIPDQDWTRAWMDRYEPMRFGRRLWIYPWNFDPPADADDAVVVRLDPGLAFGSGTHPTTALCLQWLDAGDFVGKTVIDYGCGSGVLAIAALKLGAARVVGIDNDPQALTASRDNAERNGVAERLSLHLPDEFVAQPADALVANILAGPLLELAPRFAACCRPGAAFAMSGILHGQHEELLARYADWFDALEIAVADGWVRIAGIRR